MSHVTGTVQNVAPPWVIGPDTGAPPGPGGVWSRAFTPASASTGTKFVVLHFRNVVLPPANRLEVQPRVRHRRLHRCQRRRVLDEADRRCPDGGSGGSGPVRRRRERQRQGRDRQLRARRAPRGSPGSDRPVQQRPVPSHGSIRRAQVRPVLVLQPAGAAVGEPALRTPGRHPSRRRAERGHARHGPRGRPATRPPRLDLQRHADRAGSLHLRRPLHGHRRRGRRELCHVRLRDRLRRSVSAAYAPRFHKVVRVVARHWNFAATPPFNYVLLQLEPATGSLGVPAVPVRHDLPGVNEQIFGSPPQRRGQEDLAAAGRHRASARSSASGIRVNTDVSGGSPALGSSTCRAATSESFNRWPLLAQLLPHRLGEPGPRQPADPRTHPRRHAGVRPLRQHVHGRRHGRSKIAEAREAASLFARLSGSVPAIASAWCPSARPCRCRSTFPSPTSTGSREPRSWARLPIRAASSELFTRTSSRRSVKAWPPPGQLAPPGPRPRAILLLTDGLQNVPPSIQTSARRSRGPTSTPSATAPRRASTERC